MEAHTMPQPTHEHTPAKSTRRRAVRSILAEVDRDQIVRALEETDGRVGGRDGAASRLGLKRTTLITRMKKLGIQWNAVSEDEQAHPDSSDISDRSLFLSSPFEASTAE
jgi:transcriptional regulator with GAF, ATPase, and Fis domain